MRITGRKKNIPVSEPLELFVTPSGRLSYPIEIIWFFITTQAALKKLISNA